LFVGVGVFCCCAKEEEKDTLHARHATEAMNAINITLSNLALFLMHILEDNLNQM
jgi:hypothetical protein